MEQKIRVGKKKKPEVFEIKDFGFLAQKEGFEPSHGFTRLLP